MTLPPDDEAEILQAANLYKRRFGEAAPLALFIETPGLAAALWDAVMFGRLLTEATLAARLKVELPPEDASA
jgi:hypothetical protein